MKFTIVFKHTVNVEQRVISRNPLICFLWSAFVTLVHFFYSSHFAMLEDKFSFAVKWHLGELTFMHGFTSTNRCIKYSKHPLPHYFLFLQKLMTSKRGTSQILKRTFVEKKTKLYYYFCFFCQIQACFDTDSRYNHKILEQWTKKKKKKIQCIQCLNDV